MRRTSRSASRTSAAAERRLAFALILGALITGAQAARPQAPDRPPGATLLVPARPDSAPPESDPAPLLVPGHSPGVDSLERQRVATAVQQYALARSLEATQTNTAMQMYRNALRLDPDMRDVRYRMGLLQLRREQYQDALKSFADEVSRHPDHRDAARQMGVTLARGGRADHAIAQLQRLVDEKPDDGESWHALGFAFMSAKRPNDAERALRRAIALPPPLAEEHRDLALVLESAGRLADARAEYARALALAPRDPSSWFNLGNLEQRAGRADSAVAAYRRAQAADSSFRLAWQAEIQVLRDARRAEEELAAYRRWLAALPAEHGARVEAVELASRLGHRDQALAIAREGVAHGAQSGEAHEILGITLAGHGDVRGGVAMLRRSQTLYGRDTKRRAEVERTLARIRAAAPDSLRAFLAADSAAHVAPAPAATPKPAAPAAGTRGRR